MRVTKKFKMKYTLFTFPNCNKCSKIKNYLEGKNIEYEEVNSGIGDGRKKFREFYLNNKEQIKRDDDGGGILLPILINEKDIFQGMEKILNSF